MKPPRVVLEICYQLRGPRGTVPAVLPVEHRTDGYIGGWIHLNLPERPPRRISIRVVAVEPDGRELQHNDRRATASGKLLAQANPET